MSPFYVSSTRGAVKGGLLRLVAVIMRCLGIFFLIRNSLAREKVTIVFYHNPDQKNFEKHLAYLSSRYCIISLDLLERALNQNNWDLIPAKSLIITIDDGYKENYDLLPVIQKYKIQPTIYLCSGIIGTNRHFWHTHIQKSRCEQLKKMSEQTRENFLRNEDGFEKEREYPGERQALSVEEIKKMAAVVDFGAHSLFHPILTACSDQQSWEEISRSKSEVALLSGGRCKHFAYPNGDYASREVNFVKRAGYLTARSVEPGWNGPKSDLQRLKSFMVDDDATLSLLAMQISGYKCLTHFFKKWVSLKGCQSA